MIDLTINAIPIIISAALVGLYGGVKYYSKSLGTNPEAFEMKKFIPIVILSIVVSVGYSISGATLSPEEIATFVAENFTLVIFIDQALTIYTRSKTSPPATTVTVAPK